MSKVFARGEALPTAATGYGSQIWDREGKRYLDGSGGALVVNIGHGRAEVAETIAAQSRRVGYVHASKFTTDVLEEYAAVLSEVAPVDDARVYPVSGGSEAVETALKMARAYHLAHGSDRHMVIAREGSYHGNSRGALAVSGRRGLRGPYEPWLDHTVHIPAPYEYRCPFPASHPTGCAAAHAEHLGDTIAQLGAENIAALIAEPVSGAALGACVPPADYWAMISETCRRHGILVIADEVLTGFGRTGQWFASDHWGLQPDIIAAGKGAGSGYWPLGLTIAGRHVYDALGAGFTHGFTYSHHAAGAAAGLAVLEVLRRENLVAATAEKAPHFHAALRQRLAGHPHVGDIRGIGLLWAVELVADQDTRKPFARNEKVIERIAAAARDTGMLFYSSTGCADGVNGDAIVFGPPLTTSRAELTEMAELTTDAVRRVLPALLASAPLPGVQYRDLTRRHFHGEREPVVRHFANGEGEERTAGRFGVGQTPRLRGGVPRKRHGQPGRRLPPRDDRAGQESVELRDPTRLFNGRQGAGVGNPCGTHGSTVGRFTSFGRVP